MVSEIMGGPKAAELMEFELFGRLAVHWYFVIFFFVLVRGGLGGEDDIGERKYHYMNERK